LDGESALDSLVGAAFAAADRFAHAMRRLSRVHIALVQETHISSVSFEHSEEFVRGVRQDSGDDALAPRMCEHGHNNLCQALAVHASLSAVADFFSAL